MEKEQSIKIPPPRPKRKPSNPYPRKMANTLQSVSSIIDEDNRSSQAASFAPHQISGRNSIEDRSHESLPFAARSSRETLLAANKNSNLKEAKLELPRLSSYPSSAKLFGRTVLTATAHRAKSAISKPSLGSYSQRAFGEFPSIKHEISSLKCLTPEDQNVKRGKKAYTLGLKTQAKFHDESEISITGSPSEAALNTPTSEADCTLEDTGGINVSDSCISKLAGPQITVDQAYELPSSELDTNSDYIPREHKDHVFTSGCPRHVRVQHIVDQGVAKNIHQLPKYGPDAAFLAHPFATMSTFANNHLFFKMSGSSLADIPGSSHSSFLPQFSCIPGPYSAHPSNVNNFGLVKEFASTGIIPNNSFLLAHLLQATILQHSTPYAAATVAAACQPGSVSGGFGVTTAESLRSNEGMNGIISWERTAAAAAIAAATIAAASAWWALHGIMPPSFYTPGIYDPTAAATTTTSSVNPTPVCKPEPVFGVREQEQMNATKEDAEVFDVMSASHHVDVERNITTLEESHNAKSFIPQASSGTESEPSDYVSLVSSSDSEHEVSTSERGSCDAEACVKKISSKSVEDDQKASCTNSFHGEKIKIRKQFNRSSCGSNTTSSSDTEIDPFPGFNVEGFTGDNENFESTRSGNSGFEANIEDTSAGEEEMRDEILLGKAQRERGNFAAKKHERMEKKRNIFIKTNTTVLEER